MNKLFLAFLLMAPSLASADVPSVTAHAHDYVPNPNFVELRGIEDTGVSGIYQLGEVAILEGDYGMISYGTTGFAIRTNENYYNITKKFLSKYADDLDEVVLFVTFEDNGAP